jgi:polar amino acid transport system substrate-binding protein
VKKTVFIFTLAAVLVLMLVTTSPAGTALKHILKKGELVVGIAGSQPPLNATTKTGEIIGLDADIAKLIAMNLGVKLKFAAMPFPELLPALEAGKVDMILSSMTMTPARNRKVAFIGPYFVSGKGILTNNQTAAGLNSAEGLNNPELTLAALKDSTSQMFVEKAAPKAKLVKIKSYDKAIELLSKGKINALIADYPYCAFTAFRYRDKGLIAGQAQLTFEPLGIAVPEDTLLINLLQNFLATLNGTGQLKKLNERWLKDGSWIKELP